MYEKYISTGHKDVVAMLLSFSADIHARDYQGSALF